METKRKIIASSLILLILVLGVLMYIYRDEVFTVKMDIKYPDGCIEKYEKGELVTPVCEKGRLLQKANNDNGNTMIIDDLSLVDNIDI